MNWYINNAGAAEGPHDERAMAELARAQKLASDSLVWHSGLESWQTVAALSPAWWGAVLPTPADRPAPVLETKPIPSAAPLRSQQEAAPRRLTGPNAPSAETAAPKENGGLLKRLFGFGKKK